MYEHIVDGIDGLHAVLAGSVSSTDTLSHLKYGLPDMDCHLLAWRFWNRLSGRGELPKMNCMRARSHGLEDEAGDRIAGVVRGLDCEIDLPSGRACRHLGCSRHHSLKLEPGTVVRHAGNGSDQGIQHSSLDVKPKFLTHGG